MTNFKEQDGKLFRMLEEPVLLTPDAEMPCLVRLIQDDSPMGKHNKDLHGYNPGNLTPRICTEVIDVNDLSDPNRGSVRYDGLISVQYYHYELIGTFVEEGSKEWALYQMMQGEAVTFFDQPNRILRLVNGYIQDSISDGFWNRKSGNEFLSYASSPGWQIYKEPEQTKTMPVNEFADLFDAPIGWICKTRDGGSFPLKYIEVSPTRYAYEDKSGLTVYVMANGRYKKNGTDGRDIISCEHEQPKPEPQYKVGDWVEWCGDQYMIESAPPQSGGRYDIRSPYDELGCSVYPENIARKLSPSEVIIHIGCLSGTVKDLSYVEDGRFWFIGEKTERCPGGMHAILYDEMLDTQTRNLVESLLSAQKEE